MSRDLFEKYLKRTITEEESIKLREIIEKDKNAWNELKEHMNNFTLLGEVSNDIFRTGSVSLTTLGPFEENDLDKDYLFF